MKPKILILVILLAFLQSNGTNYYISSSSGSDLLDGKTPKSTWHNTSKLNTVLNSLQSGNSVLFICNDTFYGQVFISKLENASKNKYFGSYESSKKQVVSGTAIVVNLQLIKTNIWEAIGDDFSSKITNFFINGIPKQIGRWPNATDTDKRYLSYESSEANQINNNQLTNITYWIGAKAEVRRMRWITAQLTTKSHNTNTLQFSTNN